MGALVVLFAVSFALTAGAAWLAFGCRGVSDAFKEGLDGDALK